MSDPIKELLAESAALVAGCEKSIEDRQPILEHREEFYYAWRHSPGATIPTLCAHNKLLCALAEELYAELAKALRFSVTGGDPAIGDECDRRSNAAFQRAKEKCR